MGGFGWWYIPLEVGVKLKGRASDAGCSLAALLITCFPPRRRHRNGSHIPGQREAIRLQLILENYWCFWGFMVTNQAAIGVEMDEYAIRLCFGLHCGASDNYAEVPECACNGAVARE